jgi:hypothetical protein
MASVLNYISPVAAIAGSRFVKDTLGGGAAQGDIQAAHAQSEKDLAQGYDAGQNDYSSASDRYTPYAQTGGNAMKMYADATGVNGQGAYDTAAHNFATGDPFRQQNEDYANQQLLKTFNARGATYSGNAMLAAARGSLERGSTDWNNWLNRLQGQSQQGFQATGAQSGIDVGKGDMAMGYGQTRAGNDISYGNAMALNRGTLMNNLIGIGGVVAKGAGAGMGMKG